MRRRPEDIRRLSEVTSAAEDMALARVQKAEAKRDRTRSELRTLDEKVAASGHESNDPAFMVAGEKGWRAWHEGRRVALNRELARDEAMVQAERRMASKALARNRVANDLLKKELKAERLKKQRQ